MKKLLFLTILIIGTISAAAQPAGRAERRAGQQGIVMTERGVDDPQAHAILNDVRRHLQSFNSMRIEFTLTQENRQDGTRESEKGTILMKGEKYVLNFMGLNSISDGKNVWNFNKDANEVHITEHNPNDMETMNPLALIHNYERNFRAKLIREDIDNDIPVMIVDLNPLTNRAFHKIRVVSDKARHTIVFTEIHNKNGTIFTFRVDRMQTNVSAPDREFTFDAARHPGVEVVDLR